MSTRELVDALISGNSIAIENTYNTVMSDKMTAALDDYRVKVAQNMFNATEESVQETEPTNE